MNQEIKNRLNQINNILQKYGIDSPGKLEPGNTAKFADNFQKAFNAVPPTELLEFYQEVDGLDFNGIQIYSSYDYEENGVINGVFENNSIWHEELDDVQDIIFLGESGMDFFVFDKSKNLYQNLGRPDFTLIEEFQSFDELILNVLDQMLGDE